jgi:hypothetical protein
LFNKLKNYVVTIELILAGDENLTPNQNIDIFPAILLEAPSALFNILAYSLQSMLFCCCFCLFETFLLLPILLSIPMF